MASLTHVTYSAASSNYGTNAKGLFELLLTLFPEWEVVEVASDTTSTYSVYFRMMGNQDVLHHLGNSSSNLTFGMYYKNSEGTITIAGESYKQQTGGAPISITSSVTYDIYAIYEKDVLEIAYLRYNATSVEWSSVKFVDTCTTEEFVGAYVGYCSSSPYINTSKYRIKDGTVQAITIYSMYSQGGNNAYARMHPTCYSGANFFGNLANSNLVYRGYSEGIPMKLTVLTEFSVGGVKFISMGSTNGYAIRIDD